LCIESTFRNPSSRRKREKEEEALWEARRNGEKARERERGREEKRFLDFEGEEEEDDAAEKEKTIIINIIFKVVESGL
jgi:hypothetical protein